MNDLDVGVAVFVQWNWRIVLEGISNFLDDFIHDLAFLIPCRKFREQCPSLQKNFYRSETQPV